MKMNMIDQLKEVAELLYGDGQPQAGCTLSIDDATAWARALESSKPFCVVEKWMWLDLQITEAMRAELRGAGAFPSIIFAHNILFDSASRFPSGHWVRSTLLVSYDRDFIFETRNTRYILMGSGTRKTVLPTVAFKLR